MKFVLSIITVHLPKSDKIVEPESIHQAPSIPETLLIHKFVRQINDRGDCSIEFLKTRKPFTLNGTTKLVMSFVVTRNPIKAAKSVQRAGNWYTDDGSEWFQCPICEQWSDETCFYV